MEPHFNQISIIGVGFMGGSLALAFKKYGMSKKIIGVSREETIKKALKLKIIDGGFPYEKIDKGVDGSSLIILSSPINIIIEHIKILSKMVNSDTIITDIGSTKEKIMVTAQEEFRDNVYFVGGHPMAGSEKSGVDTADPSIFINKAYALIPGRNTPRLVMDKLRNVIITIGSIPVILTSKVHDEIVAAVSHLPQMLSVALMNAVGSFDNDSGDYFNLSGGGFYDMTRIASSQFKIWEDIYETNQNNVKKAISIYIEKLEEIKELIGNEKLKSEFEKANQFRKILNELKD